MDKERQRKTKVATKMDKERQRKTKTKEPMSDMARKGIPATQTKASFQLKYIAKLTPKNNCALASTISTIFCEIPSRIYRYI